MVSANPFIAVYIMASATNGTLYIGVTSELGERVLGHKHGRYEGFSKKYGCTRLVWFERHGDMASAIARGKQLKTWRRKWKLALINEANPQWRDLADGWSDETTWDFDGWYETWLRRPEGE